MNAMKAFDNIRISVKLPAIIVGVGLFTAIITAVLGYFSAEASLKRESEHKLDAVLHDRL